jgi:putative membrane protein
MHLATLFPLHTGGSYPEGWLHSDWRPEPTVILGIFALIAVYLWLTGPKNRAADGSTINPVSDGQRAAFVVGSLVMLIALNPPLDDWSGSYLLSAHMFQHLLLIFVTAPLWLAGMPEWLLRKLVSPRPIFFLGYWLTRPLIGFVLANAIFTFWHVPVVYDTALNHELVHVVQHQAFLVAGLLSWWPIFGRLKEWPGLSQPMKCLYLFATTIPGGIVGAFITLAEPGLYTPYRDVPRLWGMSLATDQEIAGLMMWVLTSVIYLLIITVVFFQWASKEEAKERRTVSSSTPAVADGAARLDSSTSSLPG